VRHRFEKKDYTKPLFIVTAYSEFFLQARKDVEFRRAIQSADLVVADGVSVLAAGDYLNSASRGLVGDFVDGLRIGVKVLRGGYPDRVVGVRLARQACELAAARGGRVMFVGGWQGAAQETAMRMAAYHPTLKTQWHEGPASLEKATKEERAQLIKAIEAFKPDLLLVSFGRFKQEKWIRAHIGQLRAQVVIGVGSAFDELSGQGKWAKAVPEWVERMGLKWLWRVTVEPAHWKRAWNAFPVFPWKVFLEKLDGSGKKV